MFMWFKFFLGLRRFKIITKIYRYNMIDRVLYSLLDHYYFISLIQIYIIAYNLSFSIQILFSPGF